MAGVQLTDLSKHTDAYGTNQNFKKSAKILKENKDPFAGSLSRDKHYFRDPKTGSAQWKGLLDDENPDVRDNEFYNSARSFISLDKEGFKQSDDAYERWQHFALNEFSPTNKVGGLADRIDTPDVQSFYDSYYASRLVSDEDFVSSGALGYMFEQPAAIAKSESNPNEANISPSEGVDV